MDKIYLVWFWIGSMLSEEIEDAYEINLAAFPTLDKAYDYIIKYDNFPDQSVFFGGDSVEEDDFPDQRVFFGGDSVEEDKKLNNIEDDTIVYTIGAFDMYHLTDGLVRDITGNVERDAHGEIISGTNIKLGIEIVEFINNE